MNDYATQGCYPDLNILLDLPRSRGCAAATNGRPGSLLTSGSRPAAWAATPPGGPFDDRPLELRRRIRQEFLALAQVRQPQAWAIIDAAGSSRRPLPPSGAPSSP